MYFYSLVSNAKEDTDHLFSILEQQFRRDTRFVLHMKSRIIYLLWTGSSAALEANDFRIIEDMMAQLGIESFFRWVSACSAVAIYHNVHPKPKILFPRRSEWKKIIRDQENDKAE